MAYIPVVSGETGEFRNDVERFLDAQEAVSERIAELHTQASERDMLVSFGAEIEYEFVPDPAKSGAAEVDQEEMYEQVVGKLQDFAGSRPYMKGAVLIPEETTGTIMVTEKDLFGLYNSEQGEDGISEIKTLPADGNESVKRYWETINAIGVVAAENSQLALLHSTHINSAIRSRDSAHYPDIMPTFIREAGPYIAAVQANLNALRTLQMDAGLERGISVTEAFPTKDASTAIHAYRLENRHPLVGVVDPRVDVLATLYAANQFADGSVPQEAMDDLRLGHVYRADSFYGPLEVVRLMSLIDKETDRLVMASQLEPSAWSKALRTAAADFVADATAERYTSIEAEEGNVLKGLVGSLRYALGTLLVDHDSEYASELNKLVYKTEITKTGTNYYTTPQVVYDSPESYKQRRSDALESPLVRGILGRSRSHVVSADEAVTRRRLLIQNNMIVTD